MRLIVHDQDTDLHNVFNIVHVTNIVTSNYGKRYGSVNATLRMGQ